METQRISLERTADPTQGFLIPFSKPGAACLPIAEFATIGRDPDCQISVPDEFVSSRHARIERRPTGFLLRDLRSRNGTFLNGSQVTEAILTPGDRLRVGETVFVFSESAPTAIALSSKNPAWKQQLDRLPSLAATSFPVLITGPSGAGKEILASTIHQQSVRAQGPFITINCSALNENLIESELFGHTRGSFTGATADRKGAFETARGGTLFLDEIGDLPLSLQPKLLRALENNEIRPVGSDRAIETDVRILAATHKDLNLEVFEGSFREDLYYRLNVCQLRAPALIQRLEDFDDLVYRFARQYRVRFSFNAIEHLKKHRWPGNIRELKNLVARASAYYPGKHIQPNDLDGIMQVIQVTPALQLNSSDLPDSVSGANADDMQKQLPSSSVIKDIERDMIVSRLAMNHGNQRKTALDLGIPKSTLHDRIRTYSIDVKQFCPRPMISL